MRLGIVIPTLNEASHIGATLNALQSLRGSECEIILVDGGSQDATLRLAKGLVDRCISASTGRALQMNAGAQICQARWLVFLHGDTVMPIAAQTELIERLARAEANELSSCWGFFKLRLIGRPRSLRIVERMINWRSRFTGIATGDQAIWLSAELFERVGGFPLIALMEDIALSRLLKAYAPPVCLRQCVETSGRRWEYFGVARTILLMWGLRLAFFLGVSPKLLARLYYGKNHKKI